MQIAANVQCFLNNEILLCKVQKNYLCEIENYNQVSCSEVILLCALQDYMIVSLPWIAYCHEPRISNLIVHMWNLVRQRITQWGNKKTTKQSWDFYVCGKRKSIKLFLLCRSELCFAALVRFLLSSVFYISLCYQCIYLQYFYCRQFVLTLFNLHFHFPSPYRY